MASPDPTFPGAPRGFNGLLSAAGYGARFVRVRDLSEGLSVIATVSEGRLARAMNPMQRVSSGFSLAITFRSEAERDAFMTWMTGYVQAVASGTGVGAMRAQVPYADFDLIGVPQGPFALGGHVGQITAITALTFVGARDPLDVSAAITDKNRGVSYYVGPTSGTTTGPYFYPSGTQLSGTAGFDDSLYDATSITDGLQPGQGAEGDQAINRVIDKIAGVVGKIF